MEGRITRLNQFLEYEHVSQSKLAVDLNTSQPTISSILSGKRSLSRGMIARLCARFPHLNRSWLEFGEGDMLKVDHPNVTDAADARDMQRVIPFYDAETTGGFNGPVSSSGDVGAVVGYIQAGGWFEGRETAAIRHVGDSMSEYPNGCVLAVREVENIRLLVPGRNYVIETTEYRVTKRVQKGSLPDCIALYSTNPERYEDGRLVYEPFEVALSDIRRIFSVLGYIVNQSGEFRLIKP